MPVCKHIDFQFSIPFGYTYEAENSSFVKEYKPMFAKLDLSAIREYNAGRGSTGYSRHAMLKALIVYACEGYRSIPQLIKELQAKPYFAKYILGFKSSIPNSSQFYRFLNAFNPEHVRRLLTQVNKKRYGNNLPKLVAIDSKPIKANTKHNNPKTFRRNLSDKNDKPKRNESATLCYFSKSNDEKNGKETKVFFWGYRIHLIVDANNDNPLMYQLEPNNRKDHCVAKDMYRKLIDHFPELYKSNLSQLADKSYYAKVIFEHFNLLFGGKSFIPKKRNATETEFQTPICRQGHKMKYHSSWFEQEQQRFRIRFVCPHKHPCAHAKKRCLRYWQTRKPYPGEVNQMSTTFKATYPKRQSVERVNAYLQNLRWETPRSFLMNGIENIIGLALLGKALK